MTYADAYNLRTSTVKFNDVADAIDGTLTRNWGGTTTGTATAYVANPSPAWTSYVTGASIVVVPHTSNTGASTINVSSLGNTTIQKNGAATVAGDLASGQPVLLIYSGGVFNIYAPPTGNFTASGGTITVGNSSNNTTRRVGFLTSTGGTSAVESLTVGTNDQALVFKTTSGTEAERMRLTGDGRLGINSTAPSHPLQVSGGTVNTGGLSNVVSVFCAGSTSTSNAGVAIGSITGNTPFIAATKLGSGSATDLRVYTNDIERVRFSSNGDLIATGSRTAFGINNIFCLGGINNNNVILLRPGATDGGANGATIWLYGASANVNAHNITLDTGTTGSIIFSNSGTTRMTMLSDGKLGLGMSPSYQLQLSTDSAAKPSTNTWTIASDSRIKTNVTAYTKGLAEIKQVNPITYEYNGKGGFAAGPGGISIIAQDLQPIFPECISTFMAKLEEGDTEDTELYNYNGHAITFALINAVKELAARVEALEAE